VKDVRNDKFSVLSYVHKRKGESPSGLKPEAAAAAISGNEQIAENLVFRQWIEDIRAELVSARGRSEEEKQIYNDTLNRAILGYEEDRGKLLALVYDLVAKRRLKELPPLTHNYESLPEAIFAEIIGLNVLELVLKNKE
jgi:pilus assembly protein CpaF